MTRTVVKVQDANDGIDRGFKDLHSTAGCYSGWNNVNKSFRVNSFALILFGTDPGCQMFALMFTQHIMRVLAVLWSDWCHFPPLLILSPLQNLYAGNLQSAFTGPVKVCKDSSGCSGLLHHNSFSRQCYLRLCIRSPASENCSVISCQGTETSP